MNNNYFIKNDVLVIILNYKRGELECLVDVEDFTLVNSFPNKWRASIDKYGNARCVHHEERIGHGRRISTNLGRLLLNPPCNMIVEHINGNNLDFRRSNLRILTHSQKGQNRKGAQVNSKSGIRGVCFDKLRNKWKASVKLNGKKIYDKRFDTKEQAENAVINKRLELMTHSEMDKDYKIVKLYCEKFLLEEKYLSNNFITTIKMREIDDIKKRLEAINRELYLLLN